MVGRNSDSPAQYDGKALDDGWVEVVKGHIGFTGPSIGSEEAVRRAFDHDTRLVRPRDGKFNFGSATASDACSEAGVRTRIVSRLPGCQHGGPSQEILRLDCDYVIITELSGG